MIKLRNRVSQRAREIAIISATNASIDEIEAMLNKISVGRYQYSGPVSDYFQFDVNASKLYLHTIEGKKFEVGLTEV